MKEIKKYIIIKFIFLMIILINTISFAVEGYTCKLVMSGNKNKLKAGEDMTILLQVSEINAGNGIAVYNGVIEYDEKVFDLNVAADSNQDWQVSTVGNVITAIKSDYEATKENQEIGKILLKVKQDAKPGEYIIKLKNNEFADESSFNVEDISINIEIIDNDNNKVENEEDSNQGESNSGENDKEENNKVDSDDGENNKEENDKVDSNNGENDKEENNKVDSNNGENDKEENNKADSNSGENNKQENNEEDKKVDNKKENVNSSVNNQTSIEKEESNQVQSNKQENNKVTNNKIENSNKVASNVVENTANTILPKAGKKALNIIKIVLSVIIIVSVIFYKKYNNLKGI